VTLSATIEEGASVTGEGVGGGERLVEGLAMGEVVVGERVGAEVELDDGEPLLPPPLPDPLPPLPDPPDPGPVEYDMETDMETDMENSKYLSNSMSLCEIKQQCKRWR
jgi:hypothetical protein